MFISLNWIREFCPFETGETPVEIGTRFSLHAAEVEQIEEWGTSLGGILVAEVLEVSPHPNADKLSVTKVRVDRGGTLQVVCGAPNVRAGLLTPYAPPGARFGEIMVESRDFRGVTSEGILCSQKELEVSGDGAGIWELPAGATVGAPLLDVYPELRDTILEVDNKSLTHRPDLWGHYGLAREFSAIYRVPLRELSVDESLTTASGQSRVRVTIDGDGVAGRGGLCPRYCGLQIDGVKVGPSPAWLQHRLLAIGSRPINNIVDVTNYILFEIGQPLHAFDTDHLQGGEVRVRRAHEGESMRLLDDSVVELLPEDLVIADARDPVALAGIMGGAGSEISSATTSLFLESANFSPVRVRRTSTRVGTRTDSSQRFEKSLDPENARIGILRAARMILEMCPGAKVVGELQDVGYEPAPPIEIRTDAAFLTGRLGAEIATADARGSLTWLGFTVAGDDEGDWTVTVPSWRGTKDISIREDLVEEVGRIFGYDNVTPFAPAWPVTAPEVNLHRRAERSAKAFLTTYHGLAEVYTYSMVGKAHCELFGLDPEAHLKLCNPTSEELDRMRREIAPLLLEKARDNQRYFQDFGFFELGRVFRKEPERLREPELPEEHNRLVGLLSRPQKTPENFYTLRDLVLALLFHLKVADVTLLPFSTGTELPRWVHPKVGGIVQVAGEERGQIYRVHPVMESRLELKGDVLVFDLDFDAVVDPTRPARVTSYEPPLRFPTVPFDVAVVAPLREPVRDILAVVEASAGAELRELEVFDVFTDAERLGADKKSVAMHMVFGSRERTLRNEEIEALQNQVIQALEGKGYPLRD